MYYTNSIYIIECLNVIPNLRQTNYHAWFHTSVVNIIQVQNICSKAVNFDMCMNSCENFNFCSRCVILYLCNLNFSIWVQLFGPCLPGSATRENILSFSRPHVGHCQSTICRNLLNIKTAATCTEKTAINLLLFCGGLRSLQIWH